MTHKTVDTDLVHDTYSDVTEVHTGLTAEQVELLGILGWCAACGPARLTLRQWQIVDRLIAWRGTSPAVPAPRQSPETDPSSSSSRSATP